MRSLKPDRKSRVRGRSERGITRGVTRGSAPQPAFGRRTKLRNDPISRAVRAIRRILDFRRPMLIMSLAILALVLMAGLFASGFVGRTIHRTDAAFGSLISEAGFGVAQVHLSGNRHTSQVTIMAALGLLPGQSIFSVDLVAARQRLLQLPWVAKAEVMRRYPDDITVSIVEKQPFARWQSSKGLYIVERSGGPIVTAGADAFHHLPLLLGDEAPKVAAPFVAAVAQHRAILARVEAYQYQSERRWNLVLDDGVIVKLPETGWNQQLGVLERLIVDKGILERDVVEIDLRSPTHYFFVRKTGVEKQKRTEAGRAI